MENCVLHQQHLHHHLGNMGTLQSPLSYSPKPHLRIIFPTKHVGAPSVCCRPMMKVRASAERNHCEFSTFNTPLEPSSKVGAFLRVVLENHRRVFHVVATEELRLLSDARDSAVARMRNSQGSGENLLHRRIAQLTEDGCQIAIQDVMYLLILYKYSEIRVPLVPKLSSCLYNGRLEVLPYKEWELESIHSMEVLDIIRDHVNVLTGVKAKTRHLTKIRQSWLARVYVASILYGYFLKSVLLRYHLERSLYLANHDLHIGHRMSGLSFHGSRDVIFGNTSDPQSTTWQGLIRQEEEGIGDLKEYVRSFHSFTLLKCAKLRSKEAVNLVESHCQALFGNKDDDNGHVLILTSFSTLKRLLLEAVAFGSFLWETENYINNVYRLTDHEAAV